MDMKGKLLVPARKRDVFMAAEVENKKRHPSKGCPMKCRCYKKALQRRVIRVSEMFVEHRSSGDARPERSEWSVFP